MLLIRRIYRRLHTIDFHIYKLKLDESSADNDRRGKWIEVENLENDDILFLGPNNYVYISASSVPNGKSIISFFFFSCLLCYFGINISINMQKNIFMFSRETNYIHIKLLPILSLPCVTNTVSSSENSVIENHNIPT